MISSNRKDDDNNNQFAALRQRNKEKPNAQNITPTDNCIFVTNVKHIRRIKFTPTGRIEIGYQPRHTIVEFFVNDNGLGIAPENQSLIFQRFSQIEPTKNQINSGNGLGLSISKALVEKLGGTIHVYSELGRGLKFAFTIPH